jgi:hypothetical protein
MGDSDYHSAGSVVALLWRLQPSLREPRWLKPELVHGAEAVMEVLAENADGRSVRFIASGSSWP